MSRPKLSFAAALAVAAAFLWSPGKLLDLQICVSCAKVLASGGDPYAQDLVIGNVTYPCLYPPLAFDLYRPVAVFFDWSSSLAGRTWNAFQVLIFLGMLFIWRKRFLGPGPDAARLLFALFAFGGPLWVELHSGNGASFEQLLIWTAFALYVDGRDMAFALLIAVSAQLKMQPAPFLVLVLLRPKPGWKPFFVGAMTMILLFGLNRVLHPGMLESFWARLHDMKEGWRYERGPNNCSVLGFIEHILEINPDLRLDYVRQARLIYAPWAVVIAAFTGVALRRIWSAAQDEAAKKRATILLLCAAYALLAPRFKDYSYFLLIPSALVALESDISTGMRVSIVVLAALNSTKSLAVNLGMGRWALFAGYFKLYAAVLVWLVLVRAAGTTRRAMDR